MMYTVPFNRTARMTLGVFLPLFLAAPLIAGCEEEGPGEEMGETIDESAEEAGDAMEDAANDVEEATDNQ